MAEPKHPDVIKRLAARVEQPQGGPSPERPLTPEQERRFAAADLSRRAQKGEFDLSKQADRDRLTPEARELVVENVKAQQQKQERERVLETLRRYWYGLGPVERLAQSVKDKEPELPADVVPMADLDGPPANTRALLPKSTPPGGYR